jgi:hypothetical protein
MLLLFHFSTVMQGIVHYIVFALDLFRKMQGLMGLIIIWNAPEDVNKPSSRHMSAISAQPRKTCC